MASGLTLPNHLRIPVLGYGTFMAKDSSLEKGLETALEAGYRHIDTAASYENEEVIGRVLKRWFDSNRLKREDIFVTTKLAPWSLYPDKVEESLKTSLAKLQLDYVDLYLIHFPICLVFKENGETYGERTDHLALWKEMEKQVDAERTKSIGVSNFNEAQITRILNNCRIKPANSQVEVHIYLQQKEHVDFCLKNGITVVGYAPLGSRGINAFYAKNGIPAKEIPDLLNNATVLEIAGKHAKTPAQVLLRFLVQRGVSVIPKSVTESRIKENANIFDFQLDDADMQRLFGLEVGHPSGRVCDFRTFPGILNHPEFPFE